MKKLLPAAFGFKAGLLLIAIALSGMVTSALGQEPVNAKQQSKAEQAQQAQEVLDRASNGIEFIENKGQWPDSVVLKADMPYGQALVSKTGMIAGIFDPRSMKAIADQQERREEVQKNGGVFNEEIIGLKGHGWQLKFLNGDPGMFVEKQKPNSDTYNYFVGNDQKKYATGANTYGEIWYRNVYPQTDVRYYTSKEGTLEYDVICNPGSDPKSVLIQVNGIDKMYLSDNGGLVFGTSVGELEFPAPYAYQRKDGKEIKVNASYQIKNGNQLSFKLEKYDPSVPLVIDPIALRWASWITNNSSNGSHGHGIWVDLATSNIYVTGYHNSTGLITVGAFQSTNGGGQDIFIGKYTEPASVGGSGTRIWQTYLGGTSTDNSYAIEQGPDGNIYMVGVTASSNWPLLGGTGFTGSSIDNRTQTTDNIFITKINPAGTSIKSAVVGGNTSENVFDLRIAANGDVIVAGSTSSTNLATLFPSAGATNTNSGSTDVLLFKINQDLSSLVWMRNFGGSGADVGNIIVTNTTTGEIYLAGQTASSNFPTTNPRQSALGGSQSGFLQKYKSDGTRLWSSYFKSATGASSAILCMEFNTLKSKLVFGGLTTGLDATNISSSGVYKSTYSGNTDFFVCRMDTNQTFNYATYFGGTGTEINLMGLNTDANDDIYLFGYSASTNYPVTANALQSTNAGGDEKVFSKLSSTGSSLLYGTYYGGASTETDPRGERGIKFANCRIYTIVTAQSNDIPLTVGALTTSKVSSTSLPEPGIVVWANPPDLSGNTLAGNQIICPGQTPSTLTGSVPSYVLPTITRNGVTSAHPSLGSAATYQWQISTDSLNWTDVSGGNTQNLAGTLIGPLYQKTYFRRVIGGDACTLPGAAGQVVIVNVFSVFATVQNVNCNGQTNGSLTTSIVGGTAPYTYLWNNGATTANRTNLAAGTYTVTVTDATSCTATNTFTVTQPLELTVSSTTTSTSCGSSNGAVSLTVSNGTSPYTYLWSNGATTQNISSVAAGNYTVTVTDAHGCIKTLTSTVSNNSTTITSTVTNVTCNGGNNGAITLNSVTGNSPFTFLWNDGVTTQNRTGLIAGNYSVVVTDNLGCVTSKSFTVTEPVFSVTISVTSAINCFGQSTGALSAGVTGGVAPLSYLWSNGMTTASISGLVAGNYSVTVTGSNGCVKNASITLTQPTAVSASCSVPNNITCNGAANGQVTVNATGGSGVYTYLWSNGSTLVAVNNLGPGTYTVTVTDNAGCTASCSSTLTQPNAIVISGVVTNPLCHGNSNGAIALTVTGGTTPYAYVWNDGNTSSSRTGLAGGSYSVQVTDANGCIQSKSFSVVDPTSVASSISSQTNVLCFGNSTGSVTVAGSGGTSPYQYSLNSGTYQASGTFSGLAAGSYTVTVKDANNCTVNQSVSITQPASALSASITSQNNVLCFGNSTGSVTVSGSGGTALYQYSLNGGSYQSSGTFTGLAAGSYTVSVKDANGCTVNQAVNITQPVAALSGSVSSQTNVLCFGNATGAVTVAAAGGTASYQFSLNGGTYQASGTFNGLAAGSYTVTIKDANNCTVNQSVTITQPAAALSASVVTQTNVACFGNATGSVTISATGGTSPYQYNINGGAYQSSPTFTGLAAATYTVGIKDANNCTTTKGVIITQPASALSVSLSSQTNVLCFGNATGAASVSASGGTASYQYSINGGPFQSSGIFTGLAAGSYNIVAKDANSCTANVGVVITQPAQALSSTIGSQTNVLCFGNSTGSVTVSASGGTSPYQYSLNGGAYQPSATFAGLAAGSYTITVKDASNCTTNQSVNITQPTSALSASISSQTNVLCFGNASGAVTVSGNGGTALYQYSLNGGSYQSSGTFTGLVAGSYTVTVKDANGCTVNQSVSITQPLSALSASIGSQTNVLCFGNSTGSATIAGAGGTTPYQYSLNGGTYQSSGTFSGLAAGSYTVTVKDANNCTINQGVIITQPASALSASVSSQTNVACFGNSTGSVTAAGSGGTSPYQYSLNGGGYQVSGSFSGLSAGSYTITVKDGNNCTTNLPVVISQPVAALSASGITTNASCGLTVDGAVDVTVNGGTAPYSYMWSNGAVTQDISNVGQGSYTVTITDFNQCALVKSFVVGTGDCQPIAVNDATTTNEDTPVSGSVTGNDTPSGDGGNVWSLVTNASNGTAVVNSNGSYTYTPNANYFGTDQFTYKVCDADGDCSSATVTITINSVDDLPIAVNDATTTNEDTPVSGTVATNDTPSGDGGNVWSLVSNSQHGSVVVNSNGTYTYTPNANYFGTDQFTYQVCDADGDCSSAIVTITINSVDDQPVAVNDATTTDEDTPVSGTVVSNDSPSGDGGNVWSLVTNGQHGSVVVNSDGSYTYIPNANYNGTDQFTYQLCDADGDCSSAIVTITINSVDDQPIAVNDATTTNEDTPVSGTVATNDAPSGDGGNVWSLVTNASNGTAVVNSNGSYTYTPNANYNGTDQFTYQVCDADGDCSSAIVTITINSVDDLPVAVNDATTTNEDTPVSGTVATNDAPSGDGGNVWSLVTNGQHGSVIVNSDGSYTYTPNANYFGTDQFTYQVCDADGDCSSANVTITINSVDDQPFAVNDATSTNEDTPVSGSVTGNDTPSGDGGNVWSLVTNASNGSAVVNTDGTYTYTPNANYFGTDQFTYQVCDADGDCSSAIVTITINSVDDQPVAVNDATTTNEDTPVSSSVTGNDTPSGDGGNVWSLVTDGINGSVIVNSDGTYTYTPNANYNGTDQFAYQVCDADGDCSSAIVTITINSVDDQPFAVNDATSTNEDTPVSGSVTGNDTPSGDGGNIWSLVSGATNGSVTVNLNGTYTYTPNANYNGTDQFTYQVCDADGDCSSAIVTITINSVDDQPFAVNDATTTNEDTPVSGSVTGNDTPSGDGGNVWSLVTDGSNGTVIVNSDGTYTYTPNANYFGTDQFTYQVCDADGDCSSAIVTITINSVDDQPFAVNDATTTDEDTPVSGTVATNDVPSGDGGNNWNLVTNGQHGSVVVNSDGTYTYTPNANYFGTDQFTYQVCDADGDCSSAIVTITINSVDDQPFAVNDATTTNEDTPVSGTVATNDAPSGDGGNVWSLVTNASNGSAVVNSDGTYTYTPNANYFGTDQFTYQVCDADGDCSSAIVTITINSVDDQPIAVNDANTTDEDTPVSGSVTGNDTPSGDGGNVWSLVTDGSNGSVIVNSDGTYTYTPNANYNGTDQFTYQVCDADGDCSSAIVTITINSVDDQPFAVNDATSTNEDTPVSGSVTGNDTPSGDGGNIWSLVSGATNGSVTVNLNGTYTYTPNTNYFGTDQFTYQVCDADGDCSSAIVTITINSVDDQPVAVNDVVATNEDTPVSGSVTGNDTPSGDGGNVWSLVTDGSNGSVIVNSDGMYTYTPNANYNGTDQFTYQVCDADGDCSSAIVTITINPGNDQPVANEDNVTTNEDTPVSGSVTGNDIPSGDGGNVWSLVTNASNGTAVVNSNGSYTYTPNANYFGTDQFTYQVCDVDGDCSSATVTITIISVDDEPFAANDATTTDEDTPVSGTVTTNDILSGDGGNVWSLVSNGQHGSVVINSDGTYTYTPNANYNGTDQFTYQLCDVDGDCSSAIVTITINSVDDQPVAVNDATTTNEDTPVSGSVTGNDTPSGDGGNVWSLVTNASNGSAVVNSDGTYTYTPNANYNGTDQFTYQVCDADGDCSSAIVTITINSVDDQPIAVNDANTTDEDTPVSGTVTGNDTPSGDGGNVWSLVTNASNGSAVVNSDGTYTYTPNANYFGTDQFTYQVCDVDGDCSSAIVTITINSVDDQPFAVNDATTTDEDTPVSGSVTGNDTPSGDGGNIWSLVSGATNGAVTVNLNGTYTYTPNANYFGTDQFTYQVCDADGDCSSAIVTITISSVDDQPFAVNDATTTNEDTPVSGTVSTNDSPSGDGGNAWSLVTDGSNGTVIVNSDGTYTYTPNANYFGTDQFTYQVCDADGDCSSAIVTITINSVDDQPFAVNDATTTDEDTPVSGTVATNDVPSGDGGNNWNLVTNGQHGSVVVNSDGTYTYTPNANYFGTDQFTYQVCDADGDCSSAIVTITINSVDDQPSAVNDAVTTNEDTPVSGTVATNDAPSGDGGNVWSLVTDGSNGTVIVNSDGTYTYTPNANYNGTDQFTYQVCDADGDCSSATVTITINSVDDQPIAVNDANTTDEDTPVSGTVTGNDTPSGDGGNVWSLVTDGSNGSVIINNDGTYTYAPNANYFGTDQFTYQVCDADGDCSSAIVMITINSVDDQPFAVNDATTIDEDTPVSGSVTGNDTPSGDGGNLWSLVTNASNGTAVVNSNGTYTYTPNANYNGTDQFTYQVCDADGDCSSAIVTITINSVDDQPVAVNDATATNEDTPVSGTVTGNDTSSGDGGNVWSLVTNAVNGTAVVNSDGTYTYTPNANYFGTDQFTYQVCDADGDCSSAIVTITINSVDDQPIAVNDANTTDEDTPVSGNVTGNDTPSGDGGNVWSLVTNASNGSAVVNSDGTYTYTPNANYFGTDQFTYQVCDVDGDCSSAIVTITINSVDDQPVAVNDANNTDEDTPVSGSVTGNDTPSGDGGNLWSLVTNASNGTAIVNSDGTYTYTPNANYNGTDQFTYQVCDVDGDCSSAIVTITINSVDDQPIAMNDATTTDEDTPVSGTVASNDAPSGDGGNVWSLVTNASNGTAIVNSDGSYTYTPNANYFGTDQFTYQVCDVDGDCSSAIVTITINSVDDQPFAINDATTTNEDTPVSGNVTSNDTPSGDGGNVWSLVTDGINGSVIVNSDGTYTYTPNANYFGTDQFTYKVCDADGDCSSAIVTITINSVDDQPVAVNDATSTDEDTPVSGNVTGNDTPSGDGGNVWSLVTDGANGSVVVNSDGSYTYTPNANYFGTDQFTYQVCDADGDCSSAIVTITINSVDDQPFAVNDATSTNEDTPVSSSVTGNDTPSGDGGNVWSLVTDGSNGTVIVNSDGTYTYTPNSNYNGTDEFTYQVCDADGDCSSAIVTITINSVDDQPVAVNDPTTTNEDTPVSGSVTGNDILSGDGGNVWSLVTDGLNGSVIVNSDGTYTYTPNANYFGADQFTYQVCDADGDCSSAIVTITINAVDDEPIAKNDANSTNEDIPVFGSVTGNDTPSGDGGNVWSLVTNASNGSAVVNSDGTYTYTPNANYNGIDQFTYQLCDVDGDCSSAIVTITINSIDDSPVAINDSNTTDEDTPVSGVAATNDTPSGDGGNVWSLVTNAGNGTAVVNSDGTYTYTPNANYNGIDQFTYQVCDADGDCSSATVTITINSVDDLPVAVNDVTSTNEDTPVSGSVTGNDAPSGDGGNIWSLVTDGANGTVIVNSDGTYTYTPNANYFGTDQFTYQVCDADGDCSSAIVTITINSVDDQPLAFNDSNVTNEDTPVSGSVAGNDVPSGDGGNIWSLVTGASNGSVTVNTDGSYTYTPNADYNGTDQFTYQVCDADGDCSSAIVTITINSVDDQPLAVNDATSTNEDTPVSGSVTANDTPSGDGGNAWSLVTDGSNGSVIVNSDGTYTYTPNANYNGTDQFTYQVCDADGDCSSAIVTITINSVDDQPVAVNDAISVNEDTPVSGSVTGNDTPSGDGGNLWSLVANANNGTAVVNSDGTYTYTPNANYNGTDQFTYQVCDADGDCSSAVVTISINAVDDQPVAVNDVNTTNEDTPVSGSVTGNDTPSGDGGNSWSLVSDGANGSAVVNSNGTYTYTPFPNFNGTDQFTYQVCDIDGDCSTAIVTISILAVDDQPLAVNDVVVTNEDVAVSGSVASFNDIPSGDGGNVWSLVTNANNGTAVVNSDGSYTYTPNANYNGTDQFTYQVCDVDGDCSSAIVTITINPVDDQPVAVNDVITTNEDTPVSGSIAANDQSSGDGGNIWSLLTAPSNGSVTLNADGSYTYTPNPNYNGSDQFAYHVCDVDGDCSSGIVTITVTPADDQPFANNDIIITNEDSPVSGSVSGNDIPSGDGGNTWSLVTNGTNGNVVFNSDGTYTYTPNSNYNGTDQFTYQVCDADGDCASATVAITVNAGNDNPVANNDNVITNEDTPLTGTVNGNDVPSGDGGNTWSLVTGASNGSVTVNPDGTFTYTPNPNFNGTDQFTYQVCDDDTDCAIAVVSIVVNAVDDHPIASDDVVTTDEDVPVSGTVATNDVLSGDGGNTWSLVSGAANGSVIVNADGTYTYTPNTNYNGVDQFSYQLCDNNGDCSTATVTVTITPVDDQPTAVSDAASTNEDTPVSGTVATNDLLSGDGGNVWSLVSGASNGLVILNADGTYTYTPNNNYNGTDQFSYRLCDADGDCSVAVVNIIINAIDDVPVAVHDEFTTNEDVPVSGTLTTNDIISGDGGNGWSLVSNGSNGTAVVNADGTFTYTPAQNYSGADEFSYQLCDADGDCFVTTVTVTINPVDDQPVAVNDALTTNEDTPISGTVAGNDVASGDGGNMWTLLVNGLHGTVVLNSNGSFTYTPNADYFGTDQFTYQVCDVDGDCAATTVLININPVDDQPFASDDAFSTNEDMPVSGSLAGNDIPSGDGGNVWSLVTGAANGSVIVNSDGTYTYTPNPNYYGTDQFTYKVCDADGDCVTSNANVTILIVPVDDVPVAVNDAATTNEDTPVSGSVAGNDVLSGDGGNTWSLVSGAAHGSVVVNTDGSYTYTPDNNYNGTDQFSYQLCDGDGDCSSATVTITINTGNDLPVANNDNFSTNEDTPLSGSVAGNDLASGDGNNIWSLVTGTSNGTVMVNPDGTFTYSPNSNFYGTDQFTYQVCDSDGDCVGATVIINVNSVDDVPFASDDAFTTNEDVPVSGTLATNDIISGDGGNTWSLVSGASNGSVVVNPDGTFTYTPNTNYNGTDQFTYQLCDADGDCSPAVVTITIDPVDNQPVAEDDNAVTNEDMPISGSVTGNDIPSGDGGNTWSLVSGASNGTVVVNPDGSYTYTPNPNYHGQDQFTYQVCDADGDCSLATTTVTIIVTSVNDLPFAMNDANTTNEDTPVSGTTVTNDILSGDGGNVWSLVSNASNGSAVVNSDGSYTYTPDLNFHGTDQFTYQLCDSDGDCSSAIVKITVLPEDDQPSVANDAVTTDEDVAISGTVTGNDAESGDGGNTWSLVIGASNGTVVVNPDGTYTYTPNANYYGTDQFSYQLCDLDGDCASATVFLTINSVDDLPLAANDAAATNEDAAISGTLSGNDVPSGDGGNVWALVTGASNGTAVVNANGTYTYTPNANFNGIDSFTYKLCDADGDCSSATVVITVQGVDDVPVAANDVVTTSEDVSVNGTVAGNDQLSGDGGNIWSLVSTTTHGTLVLNADGSFTYTPNANYHGTDQFSYNLCDADGDCSSAVVTITILSVNDPPVALGDNNSTNQGTPVSGTVNGNDGDVDGNLNNNSFTVVTNPVHGTVVMTPTGSYTYTPNSNFTGQDVFVYQVCDLGTPVYCDTALVTITVNPTGCVCTAPVNFTVDSISAVSALLCWDSIPCAKAYLVVWKMQTSQVWLYRKVIAPQHCSTFTNNYPAVYDIKVATICTNGDTSGYSNTYFFQTFPSCLPPTNLYTDNITTSKGTAHWTHGSDLNTQNIWYRQVGSAQWIQKNLTGAATSYVMKNLLTSTSYQWKVRSVCKDATRNVKGQFSEIKKFKTLGAPMKLEEPQAQLLLYPNPTISGDVELNLTFADNSVNDATVIIMSVMGNTVYKKHVAVVDGVLESEIHLLGVVPAGIYYVTVIAGGNTYKHQLVYQP